MKSWKEIAPGVALQTCEAVLKPPLRVLQIASLLHAVSFKKRKEQTNNKVEGGTTDTGE